MTRVIRTAARLTLFLCCAGVVTVGASQEPIYLARDNYIRKIFATTTQPVKSVRDIPPYVVRGLKKISGDDFRIADANQPYNATDAVLDPKLPWRQFRFATKSESHYLVCYDHGGYGSMTCVVAFAIDPSRKSAEPVFVATVWQRCESLDDLRRAYARGKLQQYRPTYIDF
jgi:hypothetical protein